MHVPMQFPSSHNIEPGPISKSAGSLQSEAASANVAVLTQATPEHSLYRPQWASSLPLAAFVSPSGASLAIEQLPSWRKGEAGGCHNAKVLQDGKQM